MTTSLFIFKVFNTRLDPFVVLFCLIQPFYTFSILPDTLPGDVLLLENALAVLLAILPLPLIHPPISEGENTEPFLLVILVLSLVLAAVEPSEHSLSLHLVVLPLSLVDAAILPDVFAKAMNVILEELPFIGAIVLPQK